MAPEASSSRSYASLQLSPAAPLSDQAPSGSLTPPMHGRCLQLAPVSVSPLTAPSADILHGVQASHLPAPDPYTECSNAFPGLLRMAPAPSIPSLMANRCSLRYGQREIWGIMPPLELSPQHLSPPKSQRLPRSSDPSYSRPTRGTPSPDTPAPSHRGVFGPPAS